VVDFSACGGENWRPQVVPWRIFWFDPPRSNLLGRRRSWPHTTKLPHPGICQRKMKRKPDQNDVPVEASSKRAQHSAPKFEDLKLDARLLRAITREEFTKPTPVQAEAIPLAVAGKDILGLGSPSSKK